MQIDPHAWVVTIPMALALVQLWLLPADHMIRRVLKEVNHREDMAWQRIGLANQPLSLSGSPKAMRMVGAAVLAALSVSSAASFASFLGVMG